MNNIKSILEHQRNYFASGVTREVSFRKMQLRKLYQAIRNHEADILNALKQDLNKSDFEGYMTEIGMVYDELRFVINKLSRWAKPKRVRTPIAHFISSSKIYSEPYGVVLIIAPWNYPFQLAIEPLIGAIAAGNCAVVKPSNYSPNVSSVIDTILKEAFEASYVSVIQGGREANQNLLEERFDYIFFTGSVAVGKVVMEAAAKHLTPISLELGGKSPCIVDETANLELAAKRIVWGKYLNSGQTCVAPDYLLVHKSIKEELVSRMKKYITSFYGKEPHNNKEYPKIINEKHYRRLLGLVKDSHIVVGGRGNDLTHQIEPTMLDQVNWNSAVMGEEIFGPILPILEFEDLREVVVEINKHPKPLALYFFTNDKTHERYVLKHTSYGGGCINDTVVHLATSHMPFGGVGESGMGGYHGKASFDTFSHKKSVLKKSNLIDIPLRYPPYKNHLKLLKKIMK
ncbi:aldehyde dehydrogenase [Mobilitalea sibirica]|uniref:Aldehyde dehydrogenase n=1 Tax=Mobilitalea sibirica TaxID=1462919 RepID=A0A8J7H4L2_9FIRM|nr:aldehyde dehydrogenase [Mobilitalea sibirica]MBH1939511.1 aldehyde dehydrogenase [Mobilitalea sibirica]